LERAAAADLDADSLTYLSVEAMDGVFAGPRCAACFDGAYPQELSEQDRQTIAGDRRNGRV
jgi:glutamine phosphoribosylpyrophosphate amidotransferase